MGQSGGRRPVHDPRWDERFPRPRRRHQLRWHGNGWELGVRQQQGYRQRRQSPVPDFRCKRINVSARVVASVSAYTVPSVRGAVISGVNTKASGGAGDGHVKNPYHGCVGRHQPRQTVGGELNQSQGEMRRHGVNL